MKKEWFFDRFCGKLLSAYTEDGVLTELATEDEAEGSALGNIYMGRVQNIVSGMQAAFVSCGFERNCYLSLNESASRFAAYDGKSGESARAIKEGDEILVQVEKLPRGTKGAKVTCDLSFVGKNLIYLPQSDFLGISRKITDEQTREALLKAADKLRGAGEGFIVRTAAQNAEKRQLKAEAEYLKRVYRSALEAAKGASAGTAVYRESSLPEKVMRDSLGAGINRIYVGDKQLYEKLLALAKLRPDIGAKKITLYEGQRALLREFGLSEQILKLTQAQVNLQNGAHLVIDRTEAMTVIDVNTGRFTGEHDLESTAFETNLLAAREIAHLVRLRNIGGIVAVDFIDMAEEEHRTAVNEELSRALFDDRAKCRVYPMNDLCVTLFTRKRTSGDVLSVLLKPCPRCTRQGFVLSDSFLNAQIRGMIMDCFAQGYRAAVVEINKRFMAKILSERIFQDDVRTVWKDKTVYMIPHESLEEENFTVRGDNSSVLSLPDNAQILY